MKIAWKVLGGLALFILGAALGSAGMLVYRNCSHDIMHIYRQGFDDLVNLVSAPENRRILYYRDPSGAPYWFAAPKKDASERDYMPVNEDGEKLNLGEETPTN